MKKQTILVGFITAAFVLVATGASFAGDRRLHRSGGNHWKGKHFAAQKHRGHNKGRHFSAPKHRGQWKRGQQARQPRANYKGRHQAPRQRWHQRGAHPRPGYRAHQKAPRRGWRAQPTSHRRPGQYGQRPQMRRPNDRHPAGASFRQQDAGRGDRGQANNRPIISRGDRQGGRNHDTVVVPDDTQARGGNRDRDGSGRQRRTEAEL